MKLYSVKLLKALTYSGESIEMGSFHYEELIVLALLENDFFDRSSQDILEYFREELKEEDYLNAGGRMVSSNVVKVLGFFELEDIRLRMAIDFQELGELYSRYLVFDERVGLDRVMETYYPDYLQYPV